MSIMIRPGASQASRGSNGAAWAFRPAQQDPMRRRQIHGPILPMEQPGFFARLFARR